MGNDAPSATSTTLAEVDYGAVQASPEFQRLRRTHRSFVFPVLGACLAWYFAYVLLASYAHDFMSTRVFGSVNIAMVLGLAQVVTTFAVTMCCSGGRQLLVRMTRRCVARVIAT